MDFQKKFQLFHDNGEVVSNNLIRFVLRTRTPVIVTTRTNTNGEFNIPSRNIVDNVEVFNKNVSFLDISNGKTGQIFKCKIVDGNKLVLIKKVDTV